MRFLKPSLEHCKNPSWFLVNRRWKPSLGIALLVRDLVHQQWQNRAQSFVGTCAFQPFKKQARIGQICLSLVGDKTGSLPNLGKCCHVALKRSERQNILSNRSWFLNGDFRGKIVADNDAERGYPACRISYATTWLADELVKLWLNATLGSLALYPCPDSWCQFIRLWIYAIPVGSKHADLWQEWLLEPTLQSHPMFVCMNVSC